MSVKPITALHDFPRPDVVPDPDLPRLLRASPAAVFADGMAQRRADGVPANPDPKRGGLSYFISEAMLSIDRPRRAWDQAQALAKARRSPRYSSSASRTVYEHELYPYAMLGSIAYGFGYRLISFADWAASATGNAVIRDQTFARIRGWIDAATVAHAQDARLTRAQRTRGVASVQTWALERDARAIVADVFELCAAEPALADMPPGCSAGLSYAWDVDEISHWRVGPKELECYREGRAPVEP